MVTFISCILALVFPHAHAAPPSECETYWKEIRALTVRFEEKQERKAGEALWARLPTGKRLAPIGCPAQDEAVRRLDVESKHRVRLLKKGDALGFKLSFRMMNIADGDFAESLDIDLGNTIRKYPRLFLEHLNAEHGAADCPEGLLRNTGEYDGDEKAADRESDARAKSLAGVKDRQLLKLRDLCVSRLSAKTSDVPSP